MKEFSNSYGPNNSSSNPSASSSDATEINQTMPKSVSTPPKYRSMISLKSLLANIHCSPIKPIGNQDRRDENTAPQHWDSVDRKLMPSPKKKLFPQEKLK